MKIFNREISIWQIMFYLSWSVLAIWLVLKVAGVIKTPPWLEYGIPGTGLLIGFLSLYHNLLKEIHNIGLVVAGHTLQLQHIDKDIEILKTDMHLVKRKLKL